MGCVNEAEQRAEPAVGADLRQDAGKPPRVHLSQGEPPSPQLGIGMEKVTFEIAADTGKSDVWCPLGKGEPVPPLAAEVVSYQWGSVELPYAWVASIADVCDLESVRELGGTQFGTVYSGQLRGGGDSVAVKVFKRSAMTTRMEWTAVLNEIEVHRDLEHPHIVQVKHVLQTPKELYVVMELGAVTLFDYMQERGQTLGEADVCVVAKQLLSALVYLHERGIAHRDLKPENVVIGMKDGVLSASLCDFGWALKFESAAQQTTIGEPAGTVQYAAPEVLDGAVGGRGVRASNAGLVVRTDVFSLGVVLYCLLHGVNPFQGATPAQRRKDIARGTPRKLRQGLGRRRPFSDLVAGMLRERPEDRPSAREGLHRTGRILSSQ
eukprot:TRINITY_DN3902_c1_g1_i1.p1 TRINITY_DN3902_c1_g1~~TRINITY_DN3902_c1_g1_i1.p1  ORF type:complete len:409 (+),score=104.96 TRINITY_DN3902_c1_g1_i1:91-1227(+)